METTNNLKRRNDSEDNPPKNEKKYARSQNQPQLQAQSQLKSLAQLQPQSKPQSPKNSLHHWHHFNTHFSSLTSPTQKNLQIKHQPPQIKLSPQWNNHQHLPSPSHYPLCSLSHLPVCSLGLIQHQDSLKPLQIHHRAKLASTENRQGPPGLALCSVESEEYPHRLSAPQSTKTAHKFGLNRKKK